MANVYAALTNVSNMMVFFSWEAVNYSKNDSKSAVGASLAPGATLYFGPNVGWAWEPGEHFKVKLVTGQTGDWVYGANSGGYSGGNSGGYSGGNSHSDTKTFHKCSRCNGTGNCKTCGGSGRKYDYGSMSIVTHEKYEQRCGVCNGTGRCGVCDGKGGSTY